MKYLRSKAIVAILVLAAVGLVLKNIILPIFYSGRPPSSVERKAEGIQKQGGISQIKKEIIQQVETMTGESLPVADIENLGWVIKYARDPFNSQMHQEEVKLRSNRKQKQQRPLTEGIYRKLVGVVEEPGKNLAVINDVIVGVGDYYEDYEVIMINSDSVELKGPDGSIERLEMEF